jgi:hypothetical protein
MTQPDRRADDITLGEVVRRLDDVSRQLASLAARLDETYLRKDVYEVKHVNLRNDVDEILEQQQWNRRLAVSGIVVPVLATIIAALILASLK